MSDRTHSGLASVTSIGIRAVVTLAGLIAAGGIVHALTRVFGPSPWSIDVYVDSPLERVPEGLELLGEVSGNAVYHVDQLPVWLKALLASGQVLSGLCVVVGAYLLVRFVELIARGRPFESRNPRRLFVLALLLVLGGPGGSLLWYLAAGYVLGARSLPAAVVVSMSEHTPWALWSLVLAGILFLIGQAFRSGARLAHDVEGLV